MHFITKLAREYRKELDGTLAIATALCGTYAIDSDTAGAIADEVRQSFAQDTREDFYQRATDARKRWDAKHGVGR